MKHAISGLFLALAFVAATTAANAAGFLVTSSSIPERGLLPVRYGFAGIGTDGTQCGGQNVSPALAWANAPAGVASYAVTMFDVDGQRGLGVVHWVAYGIAPGTTSLAEGAGSTASSMMVGGTNTQNLTTYRGSCPPPGEQPHHYVLSVYALDLAPGALAAGLTRDALFAAIKGHILAEASTVALYAR
jgi:Raf kinase inhibitor-like YbhB/YbcL family protein